MQYAVFFVSLSEVFESMDEDHDGRLDRGEFIEACERLDLSFADRLLDDHKKMDLSEPELENVFLEIDEDNGGYIRFSELCSWAAHYFTEREDGKKITPGEADEEEAVGQPEEQMDLPPPVTPRPMLSPAGGSFFGEDVAGGEDGVAESPMEKALAKAKAALAAAEEDAAAQPEAAEAAAEVDPELDGEVDPELEAACLKSGDWSYQLSKTRTNVIGRASKSKTTQAADCHPPTLGTDRTLSRKHAQIRYTETTR